MAVIEPRDHHRPVDLEAELIAAPRILRIRRVLVPAARIERIVLEEVEGGPVQRVGAALGHHVDGDAEIRAVLGRRAAGLDLDLLTASAIGRMLVAASRLAEELMPSSDRLF